MEIKDYTSANREAWNEVMPKHQAFAKEKLDELFSQSGYIIQNNVELLKIFKDLPIVGKDLIHLCCNNGSELLSIKNMGANRCVGIDICDEAIAEAKNRAKLCGIECEFVCSDVFEMPKEYNSSFDIVHITSGCLGWIPNVEIFFKLCNKLLRNTGYIVIHEIHPFSETLPFDDYKTDNRLQIVEPYFRTEPIVENDSLDYLGKTNYDAKTHYWFVHTMSSIVKSLNQNGFIINEFIESPQDISAGHAKLEELDAKIPLSMIIVGKKIEQHL